jgi:predicted nucleic acid-binding protein
MSISFFADSSFLIGLFDEKDNFHDNANEILSQLLCYNLISKPSEFHISNYVIAEVFHGLQKEIGFKRTYHIYEELKHYRYHHVKQKEVDNAILTKLKPSCNKSTGNPRFGLVDAISLEIMNKVNIYYIITDDSDFDNLPFCCRIGNVSHITERIPKYYFQKI